MKPSARISTSPLPIPAIVQPSPTETATQSGTSSPHCSAISRPPVFFPSTSVGFTAALRLYQPWRSHARWHISHVASYEPRTRKTRAPKTRSCATFGSGANSGTKITQGRETLAAAPASEVAALPVEAQATTFARRERARATPTALARSLNDAVGLRPSSLTSSLRTPGPRARRGVSTIGVHPGSSAGRRAPGASGSSSS